MYPNQQPQAYPPKQPNEMPQVQMISPSPQMSQPVAVGMQQPLVTNTNLNICPYSCYTYCGTCQENITTIITNKNGNGTYQWCFLLFLFTGCCCIPFLIDNCKDKIHQCPKCNSQLGYFEYKLF
ncbi:hypothetical protein ABPG72_014640 [Tetrahymena utriculariae]